MNFWHLQLYPEDSQGNEKEILTLSSVIGMGVWEEKTKDNRQQKQFEKAMTIGDIVVVRSGNQPIALTEVIGNYYLTDQVNKELDWFERRRKVRVLDWYKDEYNFTIPASQGTLMRCADDNAPTTQIIKKWYEKSKGNQRQMVNDIIKVLLQKKQIILQGAPGTGKTYNAKKIAEQLIGEGNIDEQRKLIQFHPAYTYEDFVRGIVAENTNEGGISYETKNKLLAQFAAIAYTNSEDSKKEPDVYSKEKWVEDYFKLFCDDVQDIIENDNNNKYQFEKSTVAIIEVEDSAFRYEVGKKRLRMLFKDIQQAYLDGNQKRPEVKDNNKLSGLARHHASYYIRVVNAFRQFLEKNQYHYSPQSVEKAPLKNYVLIIDEINRANLPAVLGELIYALEYRGTPVDSMYAVDGNQQLIIPENLYIIGTMNTADRSVGHIDYAIRRRFAFIDMLPDESVIINETAKQLFKAVKEIFKTNLSSDFEEKDVLLGHSYFFVSNNDDLQIKLDYEIKPILREYLRDGILLPSAKDAIEGLAI